MRTRAVITGLGALAPTGIGVERIWRAAVDGVGAIGRLSRYPPGATPLALAGQLPDFDPLDHLEGRIVTQTDRFTHLALVASDQALRDAGLDPSALPPYSFGVVTASCAGGVEFGQREIQLLWSRGPQHVGPYQSIAWFYAACTGQISIRHGLKGPSAVLVTDEAGGLDAVGHACREIGRGTTAMLAGGAEAPLSPFSMACQFGHQLLSRAIDPPRGYLPFTLAAAGFVPAEGGAMVVVEEEGAARRRGAVPRARVLGHCATFTGPLRFDRSAHGLTVAAQGALAEAELKPEQVDVVFADALGVPEADAAEVEVLRQVLGRRAGTVPVCAPKSGLGRAYSGAAALDVVMAVLSLESGLLPPAPYLDGPAGQALALIADLDLVTGRARNAAPRTALVLARGLSGGNSALVLGDARTT